MQPLDPFRLAEFAGLLVVPFEKISGLSEETRNELLSNAAGEWSGGAASRNLPNGKRMIILNPTHARTRHNATLMEEISHVFLGHQASRLAVKTADREGRTLARDFNAAIEEEAYSTGAAALVPYSGLKRLVEEGRTAAEIAARYHVSRKLVEYRIKVSRLWDVYKEKVLSGSP